MLSENYFCKRNSQYSRIITRKQLLAVITNHNHLASSSLTANILLSASAWLAEHKR